MLALYIILGIIAFFVLILSIPVTVEAEYIDRFLLNIRWLFIRYPIFPQKPKKKKPKKEKPVEEEIPPDNKEQMPKEKKPNPLKTFYENQGFEGVLQLVRDSADALGDFGKSLKKHFVFNELYLWIVVSHNQDAAQTALQYGETCQAVFPPMGFICSNFKVKKYDVEIEPDFIGTFSSAQFAFAFSVRPIFLINAAIALGCKLLFKVVLKVLKTKKTSKSDLSNPKSTNQKGGAIL